MLKDTSTLFNSLLCGFVPCILDAFILKCLNYAIKSIKGYNLADKFLCSGFPSVCIIRPHSHCIIAKQSVTISTN